MSDRKISGFKKFSDMKSDKIDLKSKIEEDDDDYKVSDTPGLPNLPKETVKMEKLPMNNIQPDKANEVKFYGKVARFPKLTKASKAINFLENIKISKNSIWYILVEKQDNELQMLKYNNKQGFDIHKFVIELKDFYLKKYKSNEKLSKLIESIEVSGAEEFSTIKNIPNVNVEDGKRLITKITEDLIKLLK